MDILFIQLKGEMFIRRLQRQGQLKKEIKILLSFKNTGQLKEIYVEIGDEVKEGGLLAKIDNVQLYIQLEQARAELELNQAELDKLNGWFHRRGNPNSSN